MPKKLTQQQVEQEFASKGCKLLEQYEGNQKSMKYRCKCGEIAQTSLVGFRKSDGCYKCSEASAGRKFTCDEVKQCFLDQGCELLDAEYPNNNVLLNYRCSCGCVSKVRFRDFKNGRRCLKCKGDKISGKLRVSEDDIAKLCNDHNCRFIRSWIDNKKTRIEYVCKCGRVAEAQLCNFKRFPNCWECGKAKKSGANCYMYDPDREAVAMRKRFRKMCGQHIKRFMEATGQTKTKHTHELLGYHPKDLQEHILNHPDYKNCIGKEWHVDHIFPIQAFLDHGIYDLQIINRLDNLRPMLGPENLSKADKYDIQNFLDWISK